MFVTIILSIVAVYLMFNTLYYAFFAVAALAGKNVAAIEESEFRNKIAVLIPAYKEDAVIIDTARQALGQAYDTDLFDIVVIADSLHRATVEKLSSLPLSLVEVSFEKSTKSKALNEVMARLDNSYDIAVVLDADNVMAPDFLDCVNSAYVAGHVAIQGHRVAKNNNGEMALLDGASEEINNTIFRKGHVAVGLSSALIGSGMAFDYALFKRYMSEIKALGGFDKELELRLLHDGIHITYLENALVYDEKVSKKEVFLRQRTRWISAQIDYARRHFGRAVNCLVTDRNWDYLDKVLQFVLLPRLILLGILSMAVVVTALAFSGPVAMVSVLTLGVFMLTLVAALPKDMWNKKLIKSIGRLPLVFWLMIKATLQMKKARKSFMHTPHGATPQS